MADTRRAEQRLGFRAEIGLEEGLRRDAAAVAPYKVLPDAVARVKAVALARLRLFSGS